MSEDKATKKKGGKFKKIIIPTLALLVIGGGSAAGGAYYAGAMGGENGHAKPDYPELVLKDGSTIDAPAGNGTGRLKDAGKYQVTYHPIEGSFTSNLRGGSGFAQAEMAVATYYDDRVIQALTEHDIAVRNAVVMELAESDGIALETIEGKQDLADRLRKAINKVLVDKTGFGGIDDVYFAKLVLQ